MGEPESNVQINKPAPEQEMASVLSRIVALERALESKDDPACKRRQLFYYRWVPILTAMLVVSGLVATIIAACSASSAKKSSDAAAAALESSVEFFRTDERA